MLLLDHLPPEVICHVLSFLPSQDLRALRLTSNFWNKFFESNGTSIYHHAAVEHNFARSINESLEDAVDGKGKYLHGVDTWRALCQRRFTLESNWARYGRRPLHVIAREHPDVHRVKVDEERGIVMTTHDDGGLVVRNMDTGEVLWALPHTYVRNYAHCEYSNGFLIFDRLGQAKEVWRLASEYDQSPLPADEFQQEVSFMINEHTPATKGNFKPWALLVMPELGRAFRFVYPVLLVSGLNKAYLYHIETGALIETIKETQMIRDGVILGDINYVELSPLHVLICGSSQLRIFERGSGRLLYSISSARDEFNCIHVAVDWNKTANTSTPIDECLVAPVPHHRLEEHSPNPDAEFIAVHVSPDGKTVVTLLSDSRLLVIKDIACLIKGETSLRDSAIMIHLTCSAHTPAAAGESSIYLAFEHGRVGVITTMGVFVVTLDATQHGVDDPWTKAHSASQGVGAFIHDSPYPFMIVCRILPFTKKEYLERVTCLQMTRSRMFFTWNPEALQATSSNAAVIPAIDEDRSEGEGILINEDEHTLSWKAVVYLDFTPTYVSEA